MSNCLCSSESEEEELEEEEESEDSDDYVRGGKRRKNLRPVRRSTRARVSRYDADFSKLILLQVNPPKITRQLNLILFPFLWLKY